MKRNGNEAGKRSMSNEAQAKDRVETMWKRMWKRSGNECVIIQWKRV